MGFYINSLFYRKRVQACPMRIFKFLFSCFFIIIGIQLFYNVVLASVVQGSESALYLHITPPSWTSLPCTPLVITEHRAELPVLYSSFQLVICFTHGSVYMSILISQFIFLLQFISQFTSIPLAVLTHLFSTSMTLFLPCKQVYLYYFSRFLYMH